MTERLKVGVVTDFDEARGLGTVSEIGATGAGNGPSGSGVSDAGGTWPFHCTAIADGSRTVEVGARVAFEVVAGHLGRMEAATVRKLYAGSAPSSAPPSCATSSACS